MAVSIKEKITVALFLFLCFLLQSSVFPLFSVTRIVPDMIILCVCITGWLRGEHAAMHCGFFGGLFLDVFFMDTLGLHALIYVYLGFLAGQFHRFYDEHEYRIPLMMITVGDLCVLLIRFLLFDVLYGNFRFGNYLIDRCLPEIVMTLLAGIILYPIVLRIELRFVQFTRNKSDLDDWNAPDDTGSEGVG